jgi:trk system potassium uptake protein TrkH
VRRLPPEIAIVASFASLIAVGTLLLSLPISWGEGRSIGVLDALFTATSAVCVTGLITLDTARAWSHFGQAVILALIQLGGLGILTISTFFLVLIGRPLPLAQKGLITRTHGKLTHVAVKALLVRIVSYALAIEAAGAVILTAYFAEQSGWRSGAWQGLFHAVSAFCNAGFSLFSNNLEEFAGSWTVNLTVMGLIVVGGIGFLVLTDVEEWFRRRRRLSLHSKVVLTATAILIVAGTVGFYAFEAHNVLDGRPASERFLVSLFQAVTPRTAGFNTVPYGALTNAALMMTLILMFIGGSPGSAAGGVKTSTAAILFGILISRARGMRHATLFRRTVPERLVGEAIAIVLLSVTVVMGATFLLQWTELRAMAHPGVRGAFLSLNFEAVSAFGTVGASTGITPELSDPARLITTVAMFIGRLGPLTLVLALAARAHPVSYRPAVESVRIG